MLYHHSQSLKGIVHPVYHPIPSIRGMYKYINIYYVEISMVYTNINTYKIPAYLPVKISLSSSYFIFIFPYKNIIILGGFYIEIILKISKYGISILGIILPSFCTKNILIFCRNRGNMRWMYMQNGMWKYLKMGVSGFNAPYPPLY